MHQTDCTLPTTITNAKYPTQSRFEHGYVLTLECIDGWTMDTTDNTRECVDGDWDPKITDTAAVCQESEFPAGF